MLIPQKILASFPIRLREELLRALSDPYTEGHLYEVRLRAGRLCSLTVGGENRPLMCRLSKAEIEDILTSLCRGSLYAYRECLSHGYLPLCDGWRAGVAGRYVADEHGGAGGIREVTGIALRVARRVRGAADEMIRIWERHERQGLLVLSPPGGGKTTLLREFISVISSGRGGIRCAVLDRRGELCPDDCGAYVDVLRDYPTSRGCEIALRTLSPQVLVMDEIGEEEEKGIRRALFAGVPVIASGHAGSVADFARRGRMAELLGSGAFCSAVILSQRGVTFTVREEEISCCASRVPSVS